MYQTLPEPTPNTYEIIHPSHICMHKSYISAAFFILHLLTSQLYKSQIERQATKAKARIAKLQSGHHKIISQVFLHI